MFELVHASAGVDVLSMDAAEPSTACRCSTRPPGASSSRSRRRRTRCGSAPRSRTSSATCSPVTSNAVNRWFPATRSPAEIRADAFARHLLLPLSGARRRLAAGDGVASLGHLSELVQEFEVSPAIWPPSSCGPSGSSTPTCAPSGRPVRLGPVRGPVGGPVRLAEPVPQPRGGLAPATRAAGADDPGRGGYQRGVLGIAELARWYGQEAADLEAQLEPATPTAVVDDDWDTDAPLFPDTAHGSAR